MKIINFAFIVALVLLAPVESHAKAKNLGNGFSCENSTIHKGKNLVYSLDAAKREVQQKIDKLGNSKKAKKKKKSFNKTLTAFDTCLNASFDISRQYRVFSAIYQGRGSNSKRTFATVVVAAVLEPAEFAGAEEVCVASDHLGTGEKRYYESSLSISLCKVLYDQDYSDFEEFTELPKVCPAEYQSLRILRIHLVHESDDQDPCLGSVAPTVCGGGPIADYYAAQSASYRYGISAKPEKFACPGI